MILESCSKSIGMFFSEHAVDEAVGTYEDEEIALVQGESASFVFD